MKEDRMVPKDLIDFVMNVGEPNSTFTLSWLIGRTGSAKYKIIKRWTASQDISSMAEDIYHSAYHALKDMDLRTPCKVTIRGGRRGVWERSKHFTLQRTILPGNRCGDCKGSGWYVGIVERYPCPTCKGNA